MSFTIFSDFETTAKRKFKRNNELINITVAKFLSQSFYTVSKVKNSNLFAEFHTKSSRSNYIASEIVLQYLEKRGMKITIQCANKETRSKYCRKHSDKWLQRELQLRAHLDLFAILISDRKKEMISINVLKSQYRNHDIPNRKSKNSSKHNHSSKTERSSNNNFSSSSITPSPTPSPKKARVGDFPISSKINKNQWPISLSSSSSQDSQNSNSLASPESKKSPKSKKTKILNITEISADNQFYYQKKVVNEVYDIDQIDKSNDMNYSSESISKSENDKNRRNGARSQSKKTNDFDSETGSENDPSKEKYSVSEILKYRTVSTTDKSRVPRFQQLKKKTSNLEATNKNPTSNINNSPSGKERQVTFVDQNQNLIQIAPKLSSFKPNPSNNNIKLKGSFASDFPSKSNLKPSSSSLVNPPKTVPHSTNNEPEKSNSNSPIQFQFETIKKPTNNQESVDDNQNHRKSRENRRRVRLSKNIPPKQKPIDDGDEYDVEFLREVMNEKTRSGRREKYEKYKEKNLINQIENKNDKIFCKESTYEKDWDKIAYSESSSEFEQQKSDSKFIKNDDESKKFDLSLEDNCFYFEKEPTKSNIDIGTEVNLNNLPEQQKEITEIKPNYYTFSMKICSAKKVIKTDLIATCDPYCKFIIKNEDVQSTLCSQTKIVHDTQNPEWNENFTFNVKNVEKSSISFLIFDKDLNGSDKMVNSIVLPLSKFADSINGVDEWMKLKSEIQIGNLTDLHVIVKAEPQFGSLKNVDFRKVTKDSTENDYESDQINQLKIEEEEEEKDENQTEIRNFDKNESDKNEEENQTEDKNNNNKEEEESQVEIRNANDNEEEEKNQIENKNNNKEEESQDEIRNINVDDDEIENKDNEEEENQDEIKNADNNNDDDDESQAKIKNINHGDEEERQTEIKFDSLFENESKIESNLPNSSKNEIKNSSFGLVQTEEEEENQPEFISSNKLKNEDEDEEEESQKDLQFNGEKEISFGNENFLNEEEDLSLSEGNINDNEFEFEIEEEDEI